MKKSKNFRIFRGIMFALLAVVAAVFMFNGGFVIGATLALTPFVMPLIESKSIGDTDGLARELNTAFSKMSENLKSAIEDQIKEKGHLSIDELDKKFAALGIKDDTLKSINDSLVAHGLKINQIEVSGEKNAGFKEQISKGFSVEGLAGKIKKLFQEGTGVLDVVKAVGNITTGNVTTDTGGNALLDMLNANELMEIRLQTPFIEEFANTGKTSSPVYTYVDWLPGEGDVEFLGEGGTKAQLDLDITVKSATPVKAAGYEILTEESITDIPRMESNAKNLLFKKYLLKRQNGILFGDGVGANPTGVTLIASLFNPATWTGPKVNAPNLYDAVIAAANQIYTTVSYTDDVEYYPNVAFVSPGDFSAMRLTKDKNGQYLFPSITLFNEKTIDGIRVIPKSKIPAGKILIGDFTKLNIIDYIAYSVRIGWINDQFIKNLFTMLGEGRFYCFVKALDQRAFLYDDINNIIAGIEAPVA